MKRNAKIFSLGFVVAVVALTVLISQNIVHLPIQRTTEAQFTIDLNSDPVLAGFADDIFVGKVEKQLENGKSEIGPTTAYSVTNLYQIKGTLPEKTTVKQYAGYEQGIFYSVEGDQLLKVGATYLFLSRSYDQGNWLVFSTFGHFILGEKLDPKTVDLSKNDLVVRFQKAVRDQVPFINQ